MTINTYRTVRPRWHCADCETSWTGDPVCWCCGWTDNVAAGPVPYSNAIIEQAERPSRAS